MVRWKNDIESFYKKVSAVKALATEFSRKIAQELIPAVETKIRTVEAAGIEKDARVEQLKLELKELDQVVAEKLDEYRSLVGYVPYRIGVRADWCGDHRRYIRVPGRACPGRKECLAGTSD